MLADLRKAASLSLGVLLNVHVQAGMGQSCMLPVPADLQQTCSAWPRPRLLTAATIIRLLSALVGYVSPAVGVFQQTEPWILCLAVRPGSHLFTDQQAAAEALHAAGCAPAVETARPVAAATVSARWRV